MNLQLIPAYGFRGAAYTSVLVHVLLAALLLPQALRVMPMRITGEYVRQWVLFSGGLALGLWLFAPLLLTEISTVIGLGAMTVWMLVMAWLLKIRLLST